MIKKTFLAAATVSLLLTGCGSDDTKENNKQATDGENVNHSEAVNYTVTGIEPGAGISLATEKAIETYDALNGWEVELSSTAAMMTELDKAIEDKEAIVITGWNPHWMFAKYPDMKYLEDPENVFGETETISTLARNGLKEDKPNAYKFLTQFEWSVEDMEKIMYEATENNEEVEDAAKRWVEDNKEKTDNWIKGVEDGKGETIELVSTPWDSERSSSAVVKEVMESIGFKVNITPVDVAVVFESVANGDADATLAAWLPATHADFYEKHKENFDDLGPNLEGAKIGLVVPEYMDIDSIEDLEAK